MLRLAVISAICLVACQKAGDDKKEPIQAVGSGSGSGGMSMHNGSGSAGFTRPKPEQITPPLDLKNPPADAVKTPSGLIYKKLVTNDANPAPKRNDTVLINYTGWRQSTGETFFSNKSRGQPMPLNLATTAPGFTEAMQLIKKGEKAMMWVPPTIGYKGQPPPGKAETLVYEVEVVEIQPAPEIPADVKEPPATAKATKSGIKYVVLKPGTPASGSCRNFDNATFHYTGWDNEGRMFDSTEMRKKAATVPPFRQSAPMEEILTSMNEGERVRFWVDADKMAQGGRPLPGMPKGLLCYEVEMQKIDKGKPPPATPADVAKPPTDAKKTEKGTFYKVLATGKGGPKPKPTEVVRVNYTGWTTDGRMFDSSIVKGEPAEFSLAGVIAGWTDGIPVMSVGDKVRFWIPEELAYKGAPGRPQGMLVFDVELLEIKAAKAADHPPGGPGAKATIAAPPDVAKPPTDAKKTGKGVFYKVLSPGKGGPHPTPQQTVKVHYTGWTTDGKMFDSSVTRGQPAEFPLGGVIPGWTDGLQVMSVGDKVRFWIPEELAYKGNPGGPQGMLVFDVELLEIEAIPAEVIAAYGWQSAELVAIPGGLINETYAVRVDGAPIAVLQRVHPVFGPGVNLDIDAVTQHLAARGVPTPLLIRTRDGQPAIAAWRALTWADGTTVHAVPAPAWAEVAGELVGRFHRAVADLAHTYAFARAGVHDTAAHLAKLAGLVEAGGERADIELGREVLAAAADLPPLPETPRRHGHGDLKISNVLFGEAPLRALCLVDLDTLGLTTMAFELGDAMRSWCNPRGEDAGAVGFDLAIFAAAIRGFRQIADPITTRAERESIVIGLETVCLELAARFANDCFEDRYFGWDPARFPSRRAHNLVRARGQLALGLAVRGARADALDIVLAGG